MRHLGAEYLSGGNATKWLFYFMNTGLIRKSTSNLHFVQVPNSAVQSKELTLQEKGLLAYLLSLPEDWVIYRNNLYNNLPDPKGTIDRSWKGLQDKGFIVSIRKMGGDGRFTGWEHIVYNNPAEIEINRTRDLPISVFTEVGKSAPIQINNSIQINTNTNKQAVVEILEFEDNESNDAWNNWLQYRKDQRKSVKGRTKDMQLKLLRSMTPDERIATINQSITQGWTGLFEVKTYKKQQKNEYSADVMAAFQKLADHSQ